MGRHSQARHSEAPPSHWTHQLAGLPWITIVLVLTLLVGGIDLLRPNRYAAEATLTAGEVADADRVAMLAADPDLVDIVEDQIELGEDYRGTVWLSVHHEQDDLDVHVQAVTPDPRLTALAADTAAGALVQILGEDQLTLSQPAPVPTEPTRGRSLLWVWFALAGLLAAVWMEGAHRIWLRDHAEAVPEPAR